MTNKPQLHPEFPGTAQPLPHTSEKRALGLGISPAAKPYFTCSSHDSQIQVMALMPEFYSRFIKTNTLAQEWCFEWHPECHNITQIMYRSRTNSQEQLSDTNSAPASYLPL